MLHDKQALCSTDEEADCFRIPIVKNDEIRRENARLLVKQAGGNEAFAAKLGRDPAYTSQLVGKNPRRAIGVTMARHIEECFKKPTGWLDLPQEGSSLANVVPASMGSLTTVPLISYVQAGLMSEVLDPYSLGHGFDSVTTDASVSGSAFALEIRGDSMEPLFGEGDRVVIDPAVQPRPGDFVVAKNGEQEATFKKYRPRGTSPSGDMIFELVPLNADYPTLRSDVDHLRIVGTMVEHRRYRRR